MKGFRPSFSNVDAGLRSYTKHHKRLTSQQRWIAVIQCGAACGVAAPGFFGLLAEIMHHYCHAQLFYPTTFRFSRNTSIYGVNLPRPQSVEPGTAIFLQPIDHDRNNRPPTPVPSSMTRYHLRLQHGNHAARNSASDIYRRSSLSDLVVCPK